MLECGCVLLTGVGMYDLCCVFCRPCVCGKNNLWCECVTEREFSSVLNLYVGFEWVGVLGTAYGCENMGLGCVFFGLCTCALYVNEYWRIRGDVISNHGFANPCIWITVFFLYLAFLWAVVIHIYVCKMLMFLLRMKALGLLNLASFLAEGI